MATYRNPKTGEVLSEEEFKKRFGTKPLSAPPKTTPTKKEGTLERVGGAFDRAGSRITGAIEGTGQYEGQTPIRRGVEATAGAFTAPLDAAFQALPDPVREPLGEVGKTISKGFDFLTDKLAATDLLREIGELEAQGYISPDKNPGLAAIKETLGTLAPAGEIAGDITAFGSIPDLAKAARPVVQGAADTLKGAGEGLYKTTIIPEEGTRLAMQSYQASQPTLVGRVKNMIRGEKIPDLRKPISEAETAARHGLAGTEWMLGTQAKRVASSLWDDTIEPALDQVRGKINMQNFFSEVEKEIRTKTREPSLLNSRLGALDDMRAEYARTPKASLKELQGFKEGWAEKLPESTFKGKIPGSALNYIRDIASKKARSVIYRHAGTEAKQAYIDYGNLQSIMKAGIKSVGDPAKRSLGRNVWEFLMDQAITPIATFGGMVLYRTGQGLEFVGGRGAKKVGDIVGPNDIPTKLPVQNLGTDFVDEGNLPTIQAGPKPRPKSEDLPIIR